MNPINHLLISVLQVLPRSLVKPFAMRYIAGETLEDAVRVVTQLNASRVKATFDVLGENVSTKEEVRASVKACKDVLHTVHQNQLDAYLSVKPTQVGLKIDEEFCSANMRGLLEIARSHQNFVRMDMEDSTATSSTLRLYERLRTEGFENVGVVIQACLRRSEEDLRRLISMKANVRLCKGAYVEPEAVAYREKEEIRGSYRRLLDLLLDAGCYVAIATHDEMLVTAALQTIRQNHIANATYEFQMLHGVKIKLREKIVADGHRLRIYVPFGEQWHAYSMRRFKENPQLAWTVLRALFSRN
jgi:proline dehydrogenase